MKKFIYLAVFALSCSVLIFETVLLKFFNFKMMSSWAFLIVSIAFLGIGASGTYLALRTQDIKEVNFSFLFNFVTAYTVSIPLSIMLFAWFPYSPSQRLLFPNIIFSFFYLLLFSVPFFLSGICISYILSFKELPVGRVLFFDLLGASLGCICSVVFLRTLTAYGVLALSVGFAYLAAVIFVLFLIKTNQKTSFYGLKISLPIFSCVILLVYPHIMLRLYQIDILSTNRDEEHYKIFKEDFSGRGTTYWNPITRIDLSKEGKSDADLYLSGLSEKYRNKKYTG
ncbi:MAG: hypothetical protein NC923_06885, partial [Candidatus Omnitrophica bacterium]|nr:hypothetical protein [Candidatus Omnitrophota bacterium]